MSHSNNFQSLVMCKNRICSIDVLRVFACLAVILIHTAGSPIVHNMVEYGTLWYYEYMLLNAISRWSVPAFAMISGFLFLNSNKIITFKLLFSKYIFRIICALAFWSMFYAITLNKNIYPFGIQEGHFWYLGMLIGLYLSMPIMKVIAQNERVLKYFCISWLCVMIYKFLGHFINLPINNFDSAFFVVYPGYCLVAYYLCIIKISNMYQCLIYVMGFIGLSVTIIAAVFTTDSNTVFFSYDSPNVILTSVAIFQLALRFKYVDCKFKNKLKLVSECTFGIYLVHLWILIHLFFRVHRFIPQPIPLCIICVVCAFVLGGMITFFIKKVPYFGKYIV